MAAALLPGPDCSPVEVSPLHDRGSPGGGSSPADTGGADLPLGRYRPVPRVRLPAHPVARARFPAIDAHNHLGRWLSEWIGRPGAWTVPDVAALLDLMDGCNLRAIVNLDGRWGPELEANLDRYDRADPGRFATVCHVDWAEAGAPGFGTRLADSLERSVATGARGLKVWKDLGLHVRDDRGKLLLPDDRRLTPVWETAAANGAPVFIHTADPAEFFEPIDYKNERWLELALNGDRRYQDSRFPRFEELMAERDRLFKKHPKTKFIMAHLGWHANDLGRLSKMFDEMPNLYSEVGAVLYDLGRQPRAAHDFLVKYQDRILFGKDAFFPEEYPYYWRVFETKDEYFDYYRDYHAFWKLYGLDLPDAVLKKLYFGNALKLTPGLPQAGWPK